MKIEAVVQRFVTPANSAWETPDGPPFKINVEWPDCAAPGCVPSIGDRMDRTARVWRVIGRTWSIRGLVLTLYVEERDRPLTGAAGVASEK